jgi:hypothetical protein
MSKGREKKGTVDRVQIDQRFFDCLNLIFLVLFGLLRFVAVVPFCSFGFVTWGIRRPH